jgi:hypothetical protein
MNYLRISNNGLICVEDLTLIGSSTKRDQQGKIGMFGSGWKYALAWLLRNDCSPRIFAGEKEIKIDFSVKMHRNNPVRVITVDGIESSLTTEMGMKWTGWMAIREVLSNAIDEGNHTITTSWSPNDFKGESGQTVIWIPMNGELSEVMMKFDSYFAFNRKESFNTMEARIFIKQEESIKNIYRKGIRCYDTKETSKLDFDFYEIDINEDRLTYYYNIYYKVRNIVASDIPIMLFKAIIDEENDNYIETPFNDNILNNLKQLLNAGHNFTTPSLEKLGGILFQLPNSLKISNDWYKKLQDLGLVKSIFDMMGGDKEFIRTDGKNLEGVKYYLSNIGMNIELRSGKCEENAFFSEGTGYVKDDTQLSDKLIAAKIIKSIPSETLASYLS